MAPRIPKYRPRREKNGDSIGHLKLRSSQNTYYSGHAGRQVSRPSIPTTLAAAEGAEV